MNIGNLRWPLGGLPSSMTRHLFWPWLSAARGWYGQRRVAAQAARARAGDGLIELDARTLCDIGAPHALLARAQRRRQAQCDRRDELRAGGAAGDWQRW
jgi:hypothetical protein